MKGWWGDRKYKRRGAILNNFGVRRIISRTNAFYFHKQSRSEHNTTQGNLQKTATPPFAKNLSRILPTDFHQSYLILPTIHIRMTSHDEIISPPTTDYLAPDLYAYVNIHAGQELREILGQTFRSMTPQLRKELFTQAPTDTNECAQAVDIWITRLNVIKSGLASFPMPVDRGEISTTMESLTIAPPPDGTTQAPQASPSQASITACLERDQYQCIITGRKFSDGSSTEVVPLIPFAFANHPCCRDMDFWKMLEMFFGSEAIDTLFGGLLERVDSLENLITLDSSIHTMFNSGGLALTPGTATDDPIPVINDYRGSYWLDIGYGHGVRSADFIKSTKCFSSGQVGKLYPWDRIAITCQEEMPGHAPTLPLPSYFALRDFILSLKNTIAHKPSLPDEFSLSDASSTPPSPATPVDFGNQYPTDPATSDNPCADPVLEASAILQDLVDEGALERSP